MLRPLNAPEAREPRTGRQPTTTEADVRPLNAPEAREPRTGRQPTTTEADVRPLRLPDRKHLRQSDLSSFALFYNWLGTKG